MQTISTNTQNKNLMMVYNSIYTIIEYDKNDSLFIVKRTLPYYISDSVYKNDVLRWAEAFKKYKPKYQLLDMRENKNPVSPELQVWLNNNLMKPAFASGCRKVAIVESPEPFAQVSFEQAMDELMGRKFRVEYFLDFDDARDWLVNTI